ncbi:acylphosphatase [Herbiconiux sp. P16]|uniref:acylphosphatase n=1 Tax=Herbiconiux wuyangfengii TaxID=3342794 RepID=UPI0035B754B3
MVRRRVVVRGEVQGVGYRWAARDRAVALGVTGFVQNLRDGSVLAEVEGSAAAVEAMVEWMRSGPPGAHVTSIYTSDTESNSRLVPSASGFEIRR